MERKSGILLHISSLPGKTGIGNLGSEAYKFVDFLKKSRQSYWQILPVCPTSYGDSPYQSFSTFAGNPYFIDLETLSSEGYLKPDDYEKICWGENPSYVNYEILYNERRKVFEILQRNFSSRIPADYESFCQENDSWLCDYALFMAIKDFHGGKPLENWDEGLRLRDEKSLEKFRTENSERIEYYKILQYFFFKQWKNLKKYANENSVKIIGDIPIYVAADSADVWTNPGAFELDENLCPVNVAGCPPDAFSPDGQVWGNPIYNWDEMKKSGYSWWISRLKKTLEIYDVVRIDHFRGFESYFNIPRGEKTACGGFWKKGPGIDFFDFVKKSLGDIPVIAEDLGFLTDDVRLLLEKSGFPGMKILQFAFDSREKSDYLPYRYGKNCVVYTGTHDNDTVLGWMKSASKDDIQSSMEYLHVESSDELPEAMMIAALSSVADTAILTMQDVLHLGSEARMNTPSTLGNNWKWRMTDGQLGENHAEFLSKYTRMYGRVE